MTYPEKSLMIGLGSYQIWSLCDFMKKTDIGKIFADASLLSSMGKVLEEGIKVQNRGGPQAYMLFAPSQKDVFFERAGALLQAAKDLRLVVTARLVGHVLDEIQKMEKVVDPNTHKDAYVLQGFSHGLVHRCTSELPNTIDIELGEIRFFRLSSESNALLEPDAPIWGGEFAQKFPSAVYELDEGAACLAFGRSTAAAFHFIRCLEAAIRAICRCLQIPDPIKGADRNWSNVLRLINGKLDAKWPKNARISGDAEFFDKVVGALGAMQNPYRNATMHLDAKYTEGEARHIMEMVGGVMRQVASRMDEDGNPKV